MAMLEIDKTGTASMYVRLKPKGGTNKGVHELRSQ